MAGVGDGDGALAVCVRADDHAGAALSVGRATVVAVAEAADQWLWPDGFRVSATFNSVGVTAFVNNVTDKRGVTFGYGDFGLGLQDFIIRPRTIGVTLDWKVR